MTKAEVLRRLNNTASAKKYESIVMSILVGLLVKLIVESIYDNCFAKGKLDYQRVNKVGFFDRIKIRNLTRLIGASSAYRELLKEQGITRNKYGNVFYSDVHAAVEAFGASLGPEDFLTG